MPRGEGLREKSLGLAWQDFSSQLPSLLPKGEKYPSRERFLGSDLNRHRTVEDAYARMNERERDFLSIANFEIRVLDERFAWINSHAT